MVLGSQFMRRRVAHQSRGGSTFLCPAVRSIALVDDAARHTQSNHKGGVVLTRKIKVARSPFELDGVKKRRLGRFESLLAGRRSRSNTAIILLEDDGSSVTILARKACGGGLAPAAVLRSKIQARGGAAVGGKDLHIQAVGTNIGGEVLVPGNVEHARPCHMVFLLGVH